MTTLRFRSGGSTDRIGDRPGPTSVFWEGNRSSGHQPGPGSSWPRPSIDTVPSRALDCLRHACSRASPRRPGDGACPPVAIVEGAAEIVDARRRGAAPPRASLRTIRLRARRARSLVARPGLNAYGLHIEDGYGRVSDREIADASTAASLIESWAIDEDADVLAPRTAPVTIARAPVAPPVPAAGAPEAFRVVTPSARSRPPPTAPSGTAARWRRAGALD